jgi:catechol 2,3-dioxygenase-like lactoylglutathione lyase family enzyme
MLKRPDHVTVAVTDLGSARSFFELLGFEVTIEAVISGDVMSNYMGVPDIEADHVTMVLRGSEAHFEIQLLHYRNPRITSDPRIRNLARPGFNHLAFAVENIDEIVEKLTKNNVRLRNDLMTYHDKKLVFVEGPEDITIELAEWV